MMAEPAKSWAHGTRRATPRHVALRPHRTMCTHGSRKPASQYLGLVHSCTYAALCDWKATVIYNSIMIIMRYQLHNMPPCATRLSYQLDWHAGRAY